jgi:hypothetical protein
MYYPSGTDPSDPLAPVGADGVTVLTRSTSLSRRIGIAAASAAAPASTVNMTSFELVAVHSVRRDGCNWSFVVDANMPWPG